MTFQTYY